MKSPAEYPTAEEVEALQRPLRKRLGFDPFYSKNALEGNPRKKELEIMWKRGVQRDPFVALYEKASTWRFSRPSLNTADVAEALNFLAEMTGDDAFKKAEIALQTYGLYKAENGGGLKHDVGRWLKGKRRTAIWAAMPNMHVWRKKVTTNSAAAQRTAVQLAIPGETFGAVVDCLCRTYPQWRKMIDEEARKKITQNQVSNRV